MKNKGVVTIDIDKIVSFFEDKSKVMNDYIKEHISSDYLLIYKYITHSDIPCKGKRNGTKEGLEKDYLYYLSVEEMQELEREQEKSFESAKQSNIGVPTVFFSSLGIEQLQRRNGPQTTQHEHILVNDYADIYLVNETMKYFNSQYTKRVLDKLGKKPNWYDENIDVDLLEDSDFTPINVTHAIHGIGTSADEEFTKLRMNIFKNDILIILIESKPDFKKNVFILLDKNPIFFTVIGESNSLWQKYAQKQLDVLRNNLAANVISSEEEEKTRKQQSKWRTKLAEEMMNYSTSEGEVFCPFTYLSCNYENAGTLFRASHIKAYKDCSDAQEAFDINNGLLLCANADALFDKHLISVDEDKQLLYSFTIKNNHRLLNNLLLNQPIFKSVLNEQRMEYMKYHRAEFYNLEEKRKTERL